MDVRKTLLDWLIPAYPIRPPGGPAFFIHARRKCVRRDGSLICPLIEPLIPLQASGPFTYVAIGDLVEPEAVPALRIPRRLNCIELIMSLLFWERQDWTDWLFCFKLYSSHDLTYSGFLRLGSLLKRMGVLGKSVTTFLCNLFAFRTFLIARYFSLKFREMAAQCTGAYVVEYYSAIMLGVVRAFRRLGKAVWDVQHGYIGPTHGAYSNREAFRLASAFRPSGFLVWDRRFGLNIEEATGARWESTDYLHLKAYDLGSSRNDSHPTVLYSLQWDTPVAEEIERAVKEFPHIRWSFRMHPMDRDWQRKDLDRLRALPNVSVVVASEPLAEALRRADLHITYNSGTVHEAAALGIPSLILDPTLIDRYQKEIAMGLAFPIKPGQLCDVLENFLNVQELTLPATVGPRPANGPSPSD